MESQNATNQYDQMAFLGHIVDYLFRTYLVFTCSASPASLTLVDRACFTPGTVGAFA